MRVGIWVQEHCKIRIRHPGRRSRGLCVIVPPSLYISTTSLPTYTCYLLTELSWAGYSGPHIWKLNSDSDRRNGTGNKAIVGSRVKEYMDGYVRTLSYK